MKVTCNPTLLATQNGKKAKDFINLTNLTFLIPISLQLDEVNLWYFKLRLFDSTEFIVWNIKGLLHQVVKILELEKLSLLSL